MAANQRLENCVADVNLWMTANDLKIDNDKSEFLFLHSRFRHSLPPPTISVGMENIRPSQQARNLGVIFDDTIGPFIRGKIRRVLLDEACSYKWYSSRLF